MPASVVLGEYFTTPDTTYLFTLRAAAARPEVTAIPLALDDLRAYTAGAFASERQDGSAPRELDLAVWHAQVTPLITPLLRHAGEGEILWLAPHDVLHYLPLHAAPVDDGYLVDRNPICYTPSASVMQYCRAKRQGRRQTALVMGDPQGNLPFSGAEAARVAAHFGTQPLLGPAAAKPALLAALSGEAQHGAWDVIHLACHGRFDAEHPLQSGIALAASGSGGLLTAGEIFGLQLRAELVTLSACQSGVNQRHPGDELIGLTRSLIYAGAPSVLVSLWSVDDLSTGLLMEQFYAIWRSDPQVSKAHALRASQQWLRALTRDEVLAHVQSARATARSQALAGGPQAATAQRLWFALDARRLALEEMAPGDLPFQHPFYWAPFILVGDWQ
jgi:CHAT domain-containing protein